MQDRNLQLLAWTGPACISLVLVGWMVLAGFLPPPAANLPQEEVVRLWQDNEELKRFGLIMCLWGGTLYVPFTIAVALALRSAVPAARSLTLAQAALGTFGTVFFTLNFFLLAMIPFRERSPEVIQAMHDIGFSMTFAPVAPFTFQYLLIAAVILQDGSERPLFPRWTGYANLWIGLLLIPATLIPFFDTGPLAWSGVLSFWIPVFVFCSWFVVMFIFVRRCAASSASPGVA